MNAFIAWAERSPWSPPILAVVFIGWPIVGPWLLGAT